MSSAMLFSRMADTASLLPAFVEGWAANTFHGQGVGMPDGFVNLTADVEGVKILSMTVTGAKDATSLSGSGFDTTNGTGTWACSIQHDDGTYWIYAASGITSTTITVSPGLKAAVTGKPLAALGGFSSDQHYGLQGYKAVARKIFSTTNQESYRNRYAAQITGRGATSGWTLLNGLSSVGYKTNTNNFTNTGVGSIFRSRGTYIHIFGTNVVGRGVSHTANLGGGSGRVEAFVGLSLGPNYRVRVVIDAVEVHNQVYTAHSAINVPYENATSGTIEITCATATNTNILLGDMTWWKYDRSMTWTDRVIGVNDKVVLLGDSWAARYSGGMGAELQQAMVDAGGSGTVVTVALGGMEAEWAEAQFDSRVIPEDPDVVVIEYFTNDCNAYGVNGYERWLKSLYRLGLRCQAIGARPVFLMPLPTMHQGQSTNHGVWSELIGAGLAA